MLLQQSEVKSLLSGGLYGIDRGGYPPRSADAVCLKRTVQQSKRAKLLILETFNCSA